MTRMLHRRTLLALMPALVVFCACAGLFDPAGSALRAGQDLATAGDHASAVVKFESAASAYAEQEAAATTPEAAAAAHQGLIDALVGKASSRFATDDYTDAGAAMQELMDVDESAMTNIEPARLRHSLMGTALWSLLAQQEPDDSLIPQIENLLVRDLDEDFATHVTDWLCERAPQVPAYRTCDSLGGEVSAISDLKVLAAAVEACDVVQPLAQRCEGPVGDAVTAMPKAAVVNERWMSLAQPLAASRKNTAARHGRTCASAVRSKESIETRYMRRILYGDRRAVIDAAMAMVPYDEKISAGRDKLNAMCDEVKNADWPVSLKKEVVQSITTATESCGGFCRLPAE